MNERISARRGTHVEVVTETEPQFKKACQPTQANAAPAEQDPTQNADSSRRSIALSCYSKVAVPSAPTKLGSMKHWRRRTSIPIGSLASR